MSQKKLILEKNWSDLIILDACRYDAFEVVYRDFLEKGELKKVKSAGNATPEWLEETFSNIYWDDVIYLSGNAWLSSGEMLGFQPENHFHRLVDVGNADSSASCKAETMLSFWKIFDKEYPNYKKIIHFMQPHMPYYCIDDQEVSWNANSPNWISYMRTVWYVMKYASEIFEEKENSIITSDHGQLIRHKYENLTNEQQQWMDDWEENYGETIGGIADREVGGERIIDCHPYGLDHEKLRVVPWMEKL